jgi:hypothetical protein
MAGAARSVAAVAVQYLGLQAAIQAVNAEMERTKQLQADALKQHGNLAKGQAEIILNTFGQDEKTVRTVNERARQISGKYGLPEQLVQQTAGRLMGAGVGPIEERLQALDISGALNRHTEQGLMPTALAIQQAQKLTGMTPEQSAALMQSAGSAAFIGDPAMQARFLQQVLSGVVASSGGDRRVAAEQGLEMGAWLTQVVGEERGESARTAAISLSAQMNEFFTQGFRVQVPGGSVKIKPPTDPGTPLGRVKFLQENPKIAKEFFERASFEKLFEASIQKAILDPKSAEARLLRETEAAVKPDVGALHTQIQRLESMTPQTRTASSAAQAKTIVEQFEGQITRDAVTESLRQSRDKGLGAAARFRHYSPLEVWLGSNVRDLGGWMFGNQPERFLEDLQFARGDVLRGAGVSSPDQLPGEARRVVDFLDQLIKNGAQQLEELKGIKEGISRPPATAGPAANVEMGMHRER